MYLGKQDQCHKHLWPRENKSLESGNGRADYRIKKLSQIFLFLKYFFRTAVMPQRELCECDLRLSQMTMERQGCSLEGCGVPSGAQIHLQPAGKGSPGRGLGHLKRLSHLLSLNEGIGTSYKAKYILCGTPLKVSLVVEEKPNKTAKQKAIKGKGLQTDTDSSTRKVLIVN